MILNFHVGHADKNGFFQITVTVLGKSWLQDVLAVVVIPTTLIIVKSMQTGVSFNSFPLIQLATSYIAELFADAFP